MRSLSEKRLANLLPISEARMISRAFSIESF
jgi:hypothetical protein